jgi:dTMP kinase
MSRGAFIVLEGLDGAGTTTQCAALAAVLRRKGHRVHVTAEPSSGPIGTLIRQALGGRLGLPGRHGPLTPETMALLFAADRVDHLAAEVEPALARGEVVLSDRYLLSSLAYQGAQVGMAWVESLNRAARRPDLTLFLDIDVAVAGQRRRHRGGHPELYETTEVQRATARQYRRALANRRQAGERVVVVPGALPVGEVTERCLAALGSLRRLGRAKAGR